MLPDDRRRWVRRRGAQPGGRRSPPECILSFLRTRYRGGGKVENLFLVFNFSRALVAVAVGMWESRQPSAGFPRGSWKEREGCLWLSALSTAPAFPRLLANVRYRRPPGKTARSAEDDAACDPPVGAPPTGARYVLSLQFSRFKIKSRSQIFAFMANFQLKLPPSKLINMRPNSCHVIFGHRH